MRPFRFDPHGTRSVSLTPIGGARVVIGFAGLVDGPLDDTGCQGVGAREGTSHRLPRLAARTGEPMKGVDYAAVYGADDR